MSNWVMAMWNENVARHRCVCVQKPKTLSLVISRHSKWPVNLDGFWLMCVDSWNIKIFSGRLYPKQLLAMRRTHKAVALKMRRGRVRVVTDVALRFWVNCFHSEHNSWASAEIIARSTPRQKRLTCKRTDSSSVWHGSDLTLSLYMAEI